MGSKLVTLKRLAWCNRVGLVRLSEFPDDATDPVAIGDNDPRIPSEFPDETEENGLVVFGPQRELRDWAQTGIIYTTDGVVESVDLVAYSTLMTDADGLPYLDTPHAVITQASNVANPYSTNLGLLTSGLLKIAVAAGIAVVSSASPGSDFERPLTFSTGLTRTVDTVTSDVSTGKAGGQTVSGGTLTGESLTVRANAADTTTGTVAIQGASVTGPPATFSSTANNITSAEYITAAADRDFGATPNWAGTNWARPATAARTDVTVDSVGKTFTRVAGDFTAEGYQVGMTATWEGFTNPANNAAVVITTLTPLVMTCGAATLTSEAAGASVTCSSPVWSHATAGANATTLANVNLTAAPAAGEYFQITVTIVTKTVGTLTLGIGGVACPPIGQVVGTRTAYLCNVLATGAGILTFTPSAAWVGWIDDISIKRITPAVAWISGKNVAGTTVMTLMSTGATAFGFGNGALLSCVKTSCIGIGPNALGLNTGIACTGVGTNAGQYNTGGDLTALGPNAAYQNIGASCTAMGGNALQTNIGDYCLGVGNSAGYQNTGNRVISIGYTSGYINTGSNCCFQGTAAGYQNTGSNCCFFGDSSGYQNTGASNTAIGTQAGYSASYHDSSTCTYLGNGTTVSAGSIVNSTAVGNGAIISASNQIKLGNASVKEIRPGAVAFIAQSIQSQITAAATITPTAQIAHVTGATPITTITIPSTGFNGVFVMIPDSAFTTNTGGNIALASTAVVGRAMIMTYDSNAALWYPSY
jgi:hypothetical protein